LRSHDEAVRRNASDSARALLLTVLGEFVLPIEGPVWTSTLMEILGGLGVEETAARQAFARAAAAEWIDGVREGRRTRWSLTPSGRRLLREGAERIYGFAPSGATWDGRWLVLMVSVPEINRPVRHAVRTRLAWAGFGSPAPGVWVCAHTAREAEAKQILADLGLVDEVYSFVGPFAGIGSAAQLVARAWDIDEVAAHYRAFLGLVDKLRPAGPTATMLAQARLVHEWRRMPFLDPQLPAELLPPDWIGHTAAATFRDRHAEWSAPAQSAFAAAR
jgi:phenylacetic acid degradation operon negative regulatory protein